MSEISAQTIQTADVFIRENGVRGELLDAKRRVLSSPPAIARGAQIKLHIHVFPPSGDSQYSAWPDESVFRLVASKVFVDSAEGSSEQDVSPEVLVADSVEALEDGTLEATLTNTNTVELANLIGGLGGLTLGMELTRFNTSDTTPSFLLQYPLTVLNRRGVEGTGTPQELPDNYVTMAQFEAAMEGLDPEEAAAAIGRSITTHNADANAHASLFAGKANASHTHTVSDITDFGVSWGDVTDKPASFTPSAHTHSGTDVHYDLTAIPSADTTYTLADGGNYTHSPSSAPIYIMPSITDNSTLHEITLEVKFSASALAVAFRDSNGNTITPMSSPTITANTCISFLCRYSIGLAKWCIMPVILE